MNMNPLSPHQPFTGGMPFATPVAGGAPITAYLTDEGAREIAALLTMATRNPNRCISKGQLKAAAEQLMAQNLILSKEVERLREELATAQTDLFDMRQEERRENDGRLSL